MNKSLYVHNLCECCGEGYNVGEGSSCNTYCHSMCRPSILVRIRWYITLKSRRLFNKKSHITRQCYVAFFVTYFSTY